jgi:hypothetical protein
MTGAIASATNQTVQNRTRLDYAGAARADIVLWYNALMVMLPHSPHGGRLRETRLRGAGPSGAASTTRRRANAALGDAELSIARFLLPSRDLFGNHPFLRCGGRRGCGRREHKGDPRSPTLWPIRRVEFLVKLEIQIALPRAGLRTTASGFRHATLH